MAARLVFFHSVVVLTLAAAWIFADILWRGGLTRIEIAMLALFPPLFGMVVFGFLQAMIGFVRLLRHGGEPRATLRLPDRPPPPDALPVTAIVLPIHNEEVTRVYEGLRVMLLSLIRAGYGERFHFFVLSDTRDPDTAIAEEAAWLDLCKQVRGFGRIFYRRRRTPLNRKSGNVSDFCRRWGRAYRYMIVLDADSVMDGRTMAKLVALMEAHPQVGIVQTAPRLALGTTRFARMMQFSSALYGPMFAAGQDFWQQGDGNYWGHNAILRVGAFMDHCALPELPLRGRRDARFMSHDYVEAALMRQAGFQVWLAYDLEGSFEGGPPSVYDHARRDRRWCRGNLQHAWLLLAPSIHPINRLHLLLGILAYVASPLWLVLLFFGLAQSLVDTALESSRGFDFDIGMTSFLDVGGFRLALGLFTATVAMLVGPKLLAGALALRRRTRRITFGGALPLLAGILLEQLFSTLLAPVWMMFNTRSVLGILLGRAVGWGAQARDGGGGTRWSAALRTHAPHVLAGGLLCGAAFAVRPLVGWWFAPIWLGLLLSPLLTWILDRPAPAGPAARRRIFSVPVETAPPPVLRHLQRNLAVRGKRAAADGPRPPDAELARLILDPYLNAAHHALRQRLAPEPPARREYFQRLEQRLLRDGPAQLTVREKQALLLNPDAVARLHATLWRTPVAELAAWWAAAMNQFNLLTGRPPTPLAR